MEFKEWINSGGDFLNVKVLKEMPNRVATGIIRTTPTLVEKVWDGETTLRLAMSLDINGHMYTYEMAKTYAKEVSETYGDDLTKWIGQKLDLSIIPTAKGGSVYAKAVKGGASPSSAFNSYYGSGQK